MANSFPVTDLKRNRLGRRQRQPAHERVSSGGIHLDARALVSAPRLSLAVRFQRNTAVVAAPVGDDESRVFQWLFLGIADRERHEFVHFHELQGEFPLLVAKEPAALGGELPGAQSSRSDSRPSVRWAACPSSHPGPSLRCCCRPGGAVHGMWPGRWTTGGRRC